MTTENKEFERQKRVINMMITINSILRDKYKFISVFFDTSLLIASAFLNALVFVCDDFFLNIGISPMYAKIFLGIVSILLFTLSVVGLLLNTKQKTENHSHACEQYFYLLNETRAIDELKDEIDRNNRIALFALKYSQITGVLEPIPDKVFNKLKSRHLRKVEFSRFIDKHPTKSFLFQKYTFLKDSFKRNIDE